MPGTASRVAINTGYLYARMGITMFVSLYTTRLVLNALGESDFGIFTIVGGTIALLGFFNASLSSSTQRFMSYAEGEGDLEKKKFIFNISTILHFTLGLIVALILIAAGFVFFNGLLNIPKERFEAAIIVYGSLIVSTVFNVMSVPYEAVLNAHENMRYFAVVGIIESILKLIVAYVCVYTLMDKLVIYGILMALVPIFILMIMRIYCHRKYDECFYSPQKYFDKSLAKNMTSFAGWSFLSSVAAMTTMQGMAILLNVYGGVVVNTAHGIANQLSGQLMAFSNTMLKALNPVLVKSCGAKQMNLMLQAADTGNKLSFVCFAIFAIPFIIETPYILSLWLKIVPEWTVLFCRLVFVRQLISQSYATLESCIGATGKIKKMTIYSAVLWIFPIIVGVVMYELGAPIYTIYILLIVLALLRGANAVFFCSKLCGLDLRTYLFRTFFPLVLTFILVLQIGSSFVLLFETSIARCLLVFAVSMPLYATICFLFVFNKIEREKMKSLFKSVHYKIKKRK